MSTMNLDLDDYLVLAMLQAETRSEAEEKLKETLQYVGDDVAEKELIRSVLWKIGMMTDEEYRQLDLEPYRQEPVEEDENEGDDDLE